MKILICNFGLFDMKQKVYILDSETGEQTLAGEYDLENLGKTLTDLCFTLDIDNVHLFGAEDYATALKEEIESEENKNVHLTYSKGLIKVEVN